MKPLRRVMLGQPVVLYRAPDDVAVVLEDRCVHRHMPLSRGSLRPDGTLQCPYHGLVYDRSGARIHIAAAAER